MKPRNFSPTVEQRTNALISSAQATKRAKQVPEPFDWDAAVERLKAMLDQLEDQ